MDAKNPQQGTHSASGDHEVRDDNDEDQSSAVIRGSGDGQVQQPMKRACNECRAQKLRCDAVKTTPFKPCSRCRRLGKNCVVDTVFRRRKKDVEKATMQREIDDLRRKLRLASEGKTVSTDRQSSNIAMNSEVASPTPMSTKSRKLGETPVSGTVLDELYKQFFQSYHPFLPFLDPELRPDQYFDLSELLGWAIAVVSARRFKPDPNLLKSLTPDFTKLLWSTIATMPPAYQTCKALCLICSWPLPNYNPAHDPTFQLSGIMMQIAVQNMLHLPFRILLPDEPHNIKLEQRDRLITWTACNVVAESIATIYGLPPPPECDPTLGSDIQIAPPYEVPKDIVHQLRISRLSNTIATSLYGDKSDVTGLIPETARKSTLDEMRRAYTELKKSLSENCSTIVYLHLLATNVKLNAFVFHLPESPNRLKELSVLYNVTCEFLQAVMDYQLSTSTLLEFSTNFLTQTIFSSAFALIKLLNSRFANEFDVTNGKALLFSALLSAKSISVNDDLALRFATRAPQVWKFLGAGAPWTPEKPDPLVLKIQVRMSASHVYDCIWRWRESVRAKEASAQNAAAAILEAPTEGSAPSSQPVQYSLPVDHSFAEVEDLDLFNSMDWMLGDWTDMLLDPTGLGTQSTMP